MFEAHEYMKGIFRRGGTIPTDLFDMITGKFLGEGVYRRVFACDLIPNTVIKFEVGSQRFCNITEWDMWQNLKEDMKLHKWFAPCLYISPCGTILIQARTEPTLPKDYPDKIPRLFTDNKLKNWGWLNDRVVCHDYANNRLYRGGNLAQLVKADWW